MSVDLSFRAFDQHFNVRSAAIIRKEAHILCTTADDLGFWFLPGGRLKRGESSAAALKRELREELNADVDVVAPHIIAESIFSLDHLHYHELAFYFAVSCPPNLPFVVDKDCHHLIEGDRHYRYRWIELSTDMLSEIDLQPRALHAHFIDLPSKPLHIMFNG